MACTDVLAGRGSPVRNATAHHLHVAGIRGPAAARHFVRQQMSGCPQEAVANALLLVSEIVTSEVLHGSGSITVGVARTNGEVIISATEDRLEEPESATSRTVCDDVDAASLAMQLVAGIADDFGWRRIGEPARRVLWFTLSVGEHAVR